MLPTVGGGLVSAHNSFLWREHSVWVCHSPHFISTAELFRCMTKKHRLHRRVEGIEEKSRVRNVLTGNSIGISDSSPNEYTEPHRARAKVQSGGGCGLRSLCYTRCRQYRFTQERGLSSGWLRGTCYAKVATTLAHVWKASSKMSTQYLKCN